MRNSRFKQSRDLATKSETPGKLGEISRISKDCGGITQVNGKIQ